MSWVVAGLWFAAGIATGAFIALAGMAGLRAWVLAQLREAQETYERANRRMDEVHAKWDEVHEKLDELIKLSNAYEVTNYVR